MEQIKNQITLPSFTCLDSQAAISYFLQATHCMHDSCIQSFFVSNPMHVNTVGKMIFPRENFPGESNLTVLFQSQSLVGCTIEIELIGIYSIQFAGVGKKNDGIVLEVKIDLDSADEITLICNPDDSDGIFKAKARTAFWRLRRDLTGSLNFSLHSLAE
jgi:hypothetical protein